VQVLEFLNFGVRVRGVWVTNVPVWTSHPPAAVRASCLFRGGWRSVGIG
jgi:hypothetical protein